MSFTDGMFGWVPYFTSGMCHTSPQRWFECHTSPQRWFGVPYFTSGLVWCAILHLSAGLMCLYTFGKGLANFTLHLAMARLNDKDHSLKGLAFNAYIQVWQCFIGLSHPKTFSGKGQGVVLFKDGSMTFKRDRKCTIVHHTQILPRSTIWWSQVCGQFDLLRITLGWMKPSSSIQKSQTKGQPDL